LTDPLARYFQRHPVMTRQPMRDDFLSGKNDGLAPW
jgi:hypothetical protein